MSLLGKAIVSSHEEDLPKGGANAKETKSKSAHVRVQWDPERTIRLENLPYRSIQIGVPGALVDELVEGAVKIEDVTKKAKELKRVLDGHEVVDMAGLVGRGLVSEERVFEIDDELRKF